MCGIIGAINPTGVYKAGMERVIRDLLFVDTLRGEDATGLYVVEKNGESRLAKDAVDGPTFLAYNENIDAMLSQAETHQFILGHNRSATQGKASSVDFAHPIQVPDKITLVHNGTLNYWPEKWDKNTTPHDSTAIAHIIAKHGVQYFLNTCNGAFSLVWHDMEKNTINFFRNEERPMCMLHSAEGVIFFGSELGMLGWITNRHNFKITNHFYTEPLTHYIFEKGASSPKADKLVKSCSTRGERFRGAGEDGDGWWQDTNGTFHHRHRNNWVDLDKREKETTGSGVHSGQTPGTVASSETPPNLGNGNSPTVSTAQQDTTEKSGNKSDTDSQSTHRQKRTSLTVVPKMHGTAVQQYKSFAVGKDVMISVVDYEEPVKRHNNSLYFSYLIVGQPGGGVDFPEIEIRSYVNVDHFAPTKLQKTDKFLWGKITTIFKSTEGTVYIWVVDIRESEVLDPQYQKKQKEPDLECCVSVEDCQQAGCCLVQFEPQTAKELVKAKESTQHHKAKKVVSALENQDSCQSCGTITSKKKLCIMNETLKEKNGKPLHIATRICNTCAEIYLTDRKAVVAKMYQDMQPSDVTFTRVAA